MLLVFYPFVFVFVLFPISLAFLFLLSSMFLLTCPKPSLCCLSWVSCVLILNRRTLPESNDQKYFLLWNTFSFYSHSVCFCFYLLNLEIYSLTHHLLVWICQNTMKILWTILYLSGSVVWIWVQIEQTIEPFRDIIFLISYFQVQNIVNQFYCPLKVHWKNLWKQHFIILGEACIWTREIMWMRVAVRYINVMHSNTPNWIIRANGIFNIVNVNIHFGHVWTIWIRNHQSNWHPFTLWRQPNVMPKIIRSLNVLNSKQTQNQKHHFLNSWAQLNVDNSLTDAWNMN